MTFLSTLLDNLGPSNATQASIRVPKEHPSVFMAWGGVSLLLGALVWPKRCGEKCVRSANECSHSTHPHLRPRKGDNDLHVPPPNMPEEPQVVGSWRGPLMP
jgi:hypothetical protein